MENLRRIQTTDEEDGKHVPFKDLTPDVVYMKVKEGSKIRNLIGYAMAHMGSKSSGQIVFSAYGRAVTKAITCVEILKRQVGGLHQVTKLQYKFLQEVWEQKGPNVKNPAPCLTVHKSYPSISILLSKVPLDPQEDGYQPPQPIPQTQSLKKAFVDHDKHVNSKRKKAHESVEDGNG
ncbi:ribonuclease P protein subunit p25 [Spea bombifrons]|uniref:ribonuclease P protein subunit p25 n=1 Tax=Spea bombifrons TaxID=233779 RepID=UPI00234986A5|nr:ribonuclease P protein subunit p25 [Spea bombifrons]